MNLRSSEFLAFKIAYLAEDPAHRGFNDQQIWRTFIGRKSEPEKAKKTTEDTVVECIECGCLLRIPLKECSIKCSTCKRPYKIASVVRYPKEILFLTPEFEVFRAAQAGERIQKITQEVKQAFQVLGVSEFAREEVIKAAYKKQISDYHPDKVASLGVDIRELAHQKTQSLNHAMEVIKKWQNE